MWPDANEEWRVTRFGSGFSSSNPNAGSCCRNDRSTDVILAMNSSKPLILLKVGEAGVVVQSLRFVSRATCFFHYVIISDAA